MVHIATVLLAAILCPQDAPYQYGKPPKCDVKKTEKHLWCNLCYKVLDKEKDLNEKKQCKRHKKEPKEYEFCLKYQYQCPSCLSTAMKPGACKIPECKKKRAKFEKKKSLARVNYVCWGTCRQQSFKKQRCSSKGCNKKGRSYEKSCEKSGNPPHAPPRRKR